jgi:pheromone shutdown protein TraB
VKRVEGPALIKPIVVATPSEQIYLVGTAHVSEESAAEVRDMIRRVKPDVVFVELDAKRADRLQRGAGPAEFLQVQRAWLTARRLG